MQDLLGVMTRVQSVSSYSVGSCAQVLLNCNKTAPDSFSDTAAQIQNLLLPVTDAIVASSSANNQTTTLAFSASTDPGKALTFPFVKNVTSACESCEGFAVLTQARKTALSFSWPWNLHREPRAML